MDNIKNKLEKVCGIVNGMMSQDYNEDIRLFTVYFKEKMVAELRIKTPSMDMAFNGNVIPEKIDFNIDNLTDLLNFAIEQGEKQGLTFDYVNYLGD